MVRNSVRKAKQIAEENLQSTVLDVLKEKMSENSAAKKKRNCEADILEIYEKSKRVQQVQGKKTSTRRATKQN